MSPSRSLDHEEIEWDGYIYFNLKTTGIRGRPDIIQIGAVGQDREFNRYVTPSLPINDEVAERTGITYDQGVMRHNGYRIKSVPIEEALEDFMDFIQSQPSSVLAAHQGHGFHGRILRLVAQEQGYGTDMEDAVDGVMDTLKVFNELNPHSLNSLQALMSNYMDGRTQRHHALKDARDLRTVMEENKPDKNLLEKHTRDFDGL